MTPARTDELLRLADALDAFCEKYCQTESERWVMGVVAKRLRATAHRSGVGEPVLNRLMLAVPEHLGVSENARTRLRASFREIISETGHGLEEVRGNDEEEACNRALIMCGGDPRATIKALLLANKMLEAERASLPQQGAEKPGAAEGLLDAETQKLLDYELSQHIGWLKQYVHGMTADNWRDMALRAERQLEELAEALALPSADRGDCVHRIAVTPRNGAPHGAGFACGLSGGHCLPKDGCGYSSLPSTHGATP